MNVHTLSEELHVSLVTIRVDIAELEQAGRMHRAAKEHIALIDGAPGKATAFVRMADRS